MYFSFLFSLCYYSFSVLSYSHSWCDAQHHVSSRSHFAIVIFLWLLLCFWSEQSIEWTTTHYFSLLTKYLHPHTTTTTQSSPTQCGCFSLLDGYSRFHNFCFSSFAFISLFFFETGGRKISRIKVVAISTFLDVYL